jgi:hypothetical protein
MEHRKKLRGTITGMKNLLIIVGVVLVLCVAMLYFFRAAIFSGTSNMPTKTTTTVPGTGIPGGPVVVTNSNSTSNNNTSSGSLAVSTRDGGSVTIKDFRASSSTVADQNNAGHYVLAGGLNPNTSTSPYSIFYVNADQSFNVTLLQEPIKLVRQQAEQFLMQELGLSQSDMCRLNYSVLVPYDVNQVYAGKNLGFSFCPGATQLP